MSAATDREANAASAARRDEEFERSLTALTDKVRADPGAAATAFAFTLADAFTATADELERAKRRGYVSSVREWREAAVKVRGFAVGIENYAARNPNRNWWSVDSEGVTSEPERKIGDTVTVAGCSPFDPAVAAAAADYIGHDIPGFTSPGFSIPIPPVYLAEPSSVPAVTSPFVAPVTHSVAIPAGTLSLGDRIHVASGATPVITPALTALWVDDKPHEMGGWDDKGRPMPGAPLSDRRPAPGDLHIGSVSLLVSRVTDGPSGLALTPLTGSSPAPVSTLAPEVVNPFSAPKAPGRPVSRLTYPQVGAALGQLPGNPGTSPSQVASLGKCSMSYQLGRMARHGLSGPERPDWGANGGTAFHLAVQRYEAWFADAPETDTPTDSEMLSIWTAALDETIAAQLTTAGPYAELSTWYASAGGKEGYDWWRVQGYEMLRRYADTHGGGWADEWQLVASEWAYEMEITPDLTTHGVIDQVWTNEAGRYRIEDLKSSSRIPRDPLQLGEYAWAVVRLKGVPEGDIHSAAFYSARKGEWTEFPTILERVPWDALAYRHIAASQHKGLIPMANVTDMCGGCSVKDLCPAVS